MNVALNALRQAGWSVLIKDHPHLAPTSDFVRRYPNLPAEYGAFLRGVEQCSNATETVWFLCDSHFNNTVTSPTFHWNEWERISLEAAKADDDADWAENIRRFWDGHLPFLLSVKNGYAFAALSLLPAEYGSVVVGFEPEFEDVKTVATSFTEFLDLLVQAVRGNDVSNRLRDFL